MPNPIKYSTGSESLALKKGNFYIGTGDVGKGPSDVTGYYQGVDVPNSGYTIYLYNENSSSSLSYHVANNDEELISFTNNLAGQSYTTVNECLVYYAGQTDKVCLNRDYEGIVTDGLVFGIDAGFTPSYPTSGTTCYDLSTNTFLGVLTNGPTFNTNGGGSIIFDGTNDYLRFNSFSQISTNTWTCHVFVKTFAQSSEGYVFGWRTSPIVTIGTFGGRWISHCATSGVEWITGPNAVDNSWICITSTYNGNGTQKIYSNGQLSNTKSANFTSPSTYLDLGAINGSFNFNGSLGVCLFYNRELTAEEILQNYNAQKGRFGL